MPALIQTHQLTKSYGRSRGILEVTFDIQEGEVFGFLGPNDAGKTTTMRTLIGLLHANSGSATIGGLDCWKESTEVKLDQLPGHDCGCDCAIDYRSCPIQICRHRGRISMLFL